ncbi:MAG: chloride channel protein [Coleofasciculus sp.]|uniref:chloride channel protein n=1 Tax=Coleofasciculus sp. TaxID=3100458 RepID=UPI003A16DDE3
MTTLPNSKVLLPPQSKFTSLSDRLTTLLNRLQPSPEALVLISATLISGGAGLAMVSFHHLIDLCQILAFGKLLGLLSVWGTWTLVCIPTLGGLVVGVMRWHYPHILGQGFSALLSNERVQKISPMRPIIKMLAAAISLGTGASLGPESPSVEIGSNVGILLGQFFQVSKERYRLLLGAGAAAGFAAGFNAPIAGVFFAIEVVLGTAFSTPAVSLILLSAVISAIIARLFLGVHPAFNLPTYQVLNNWEWIFYLGLGLLASLISITYTKAINLAQACFRGEVMGLTWLQKLPPAMQPVLGGACVGLVALPLPQILGVGYGTLEDILQGEQFSISFLGLLLGVKIIITAISLSSGLVGGVFAPSLFIGACLGAIYGNSLMTILPPSLSEIAPPPAYAMVGMAAVLAGSVRAPLTAILLLFELTRNYLIILPLMAAVSVTVWVVEQVQSYPSGKRLNLQQMGMNLEKQDEWEVLQQVPVDTIMQRSYVGLPASLSLLHAGWIMIQDKCHTALVFDEADQLIGIITLADIKRIINEIKPQASGTLEIKPKVRDICTQEVLYAYSDESVKDALKRMGARGLFLLPVVARNNPRNVLGVIERSKIGLVGDLVTTKEVLEPYLPKSQKS